MKTYEEILKAKIDYYGRTEAAYQFAAEEFSNMNVTEQLRLHSVNQQRELLIGLLTKLENGGGSAFIDKEQIVDDYLKAN